MKLLDFIKKHRGIIIVMVLGTILYGFLVLTFFSTNDRNTKELVRIESIRVENQYEKVLNDIFKKVDNLKIFTETIGVDNLTDEKFTEFIDHSDFRNIAFVSCSIAPDGVVEYYYSKIYSSSEIIGHDLINDERESVRNAIQYTIDNNVVVLNGPEDLILGNEGIIFRRAIFENGEFAAIINVVVDYEELTNLFNRESSTVVDIGVYDNDNNLIFGDLEYSEDLQVIKKISMPEVDWRFGVSVDSTFQRTNRITNSIVFILGIIVYIVVSSLIILYYRKNRRLIESQEHFINFDSLTQLPNRRKLKKDVANAIKNNKPFYLGFGDIDNFKNLNDILGHSVGDQFLKDTTNRIKQIINNEFFVYRWGGDEFIFIALTEDKNTVIKYLEKLYEKLKEPIIINEAKYNIQISIGLVNYPRHGITMDDLIKRADIVMYDIKSKQRNTYGFFENHYLDSLQREIDFENKVNEYTIDDFTVYLQPVLNTMTNEVYAFEALSRLFDADGNLINTFEVIKVLERKGDIPKLDRYVFKKVCDYSKKLFKESGKPFKFTFNVSPVTLSHDFVNYLEEQIRINDINPENFILEITESYGFKDIDLSVKLLKEIKKLGFLIAMDDFGMGYSSLSYIARLPLDVIKIDRYFINNYYNNEFERLIIFAIKDISKSLKLEIIVEGIETTKQLDFIKDLKAHYYQGYIHSKPMSLESIITHLKEGF